MLIMKQQGSGQLAIRIPQWSKAYTVMANGREVATTLQDVLGLSLKRGGKLELSAFKEELLGGTVTITAEAYRLESVETLYSNCAPVEHPCLAKAIPYYTWCNRGENQMRVWMSEVR